MEDSTPQNYVSKIFNSEGKRNIFSVFATGGGISSVQWLFTTPGASRSLKSGEIPYSMAASVQLFGNETPASFCSEEAAVLLAKKAYERTVKLILSEESRVLDSSEMNVFGVGCTAALATKVVKRGDHRCYLSIYSPSRILQYSIVLDKEALSRLQEDEICSQFLLHLIGEHCQLPPYMELTNTEQKNYRYQRKATSNDLATLVGKAVDTKNSLVVFPSSDAAVPVEQWKYTERCDIPPHSIIFPGSFNPLHIGHIRLIEAAIKTLTDSSQPFSGVIVFEIAAINVDKPSLETSEIIRRLAQFSLATNHDLQSLASSAATTSKSWTVAVAITATPKFVEKCELFPKQYYVIGADTFERLLDKKYYPVTIATANTSMDQNQADVGNLIRSLSLIDHYGCKFLIGGRLEQRKGGSLSSSGSTTVSFQTLQSIVAANPMAQLVTQLSSPGFFQEINENDFRVDLSSTEIRNQMMQQQQQQKPK